nr:Gal-binding and CUB domains containing receptor 8 [Arenicola marina]
MTYRARATCSGAACGHQGRRPTRPWWCLALLGLLSTPATVLGDVIANKDETLETCETEVFKVDCDVNHVIVMLGAQYGRMRFGRCVDRDYGFVGCAEDVLHLADRWCSGRRGCQIPVPNSAFKGTHPCPKDLKPYLEASYQCVPVETAEAQHCEMSSFILPSATVGYLSSLVTMETGKGSERCPWIIQARHGQRVNVTLLDFARSPAAQDNQVPDGHGVCKVYALLNEIRGESSDESSPERSLSVCSSKNRTRHVYVSGGHGLEVRIMGPGDKGRAAELTDHFLIKYQVFGCPDPDIPLNTWLERERDVAVVRCSATGQKWRLVCNGSHWQGDFGNCTDAFDATFGEIVWGSLVLPFEVSLVVVVCIAIAIGIVILAFGLVCIVSCKKKKQKRLSQCGTRETPGRQSRGHPQETKETPGRQSRGHPKQTKETPGRQRPIHSVPPQPMTLSPARGPRPPARTHSLPRRDPRQGRAGDPPTTFPPPPPPYLMDKGHEYDPVSEPPPPPPPTPPLPDPSHLFDQLPPPIYPGSPLSQTTVGLDGGGRVRVGLTQGGAPSPPPFEEPSVTPPPPGYHSPMKSPRAGVFTYPPCPANGLRGGLGEPGTPRTHPEDARGDFKFSMKIYSADGSSTGTPTYYELEPNEVPFHHTTDRHGDGGQGNRSQVRSESPRFSQTLIKPRRAFYDTSVNKVFTKTGTV